MQLSTCMKALLCTYYTYLYLHILTVPKIHLPSKKLPYFNATNPKIPHMIVATPATTKRTGKKMNANTGTDVW